MCINPLCMHTRKGKHCSLMRKYEVKRYLKKKRQKKNINYNTASRVHEKVMSITIYCV